MTTVTEYSIMLVFLRFGTTFISMDKKRLHCSCIVDIEQTQGSFFFFFNWKLTCWYNFLIEDTDEMEHV